MTWQEDPLVNYWLMALVLVVLGGVWHATGGVM